jgi:phage protein D
VLARRSRLRLLYDGTDISEDISADLDTATWTDKSDDEADDLSVSLNNAHGKWSDGWLPAKGARLTASIEVVNWDGEGGNATLPCGTFEIDQIDVTGGDGSKVTIKGVSAPITSKVRGNVKTKAWQDMTLSLIAAEMAKNAGLELYFELDDDPVYLREDQMEETDLNFLQGLCSEAGASLKVSHDRIVIFSQEKREKADAVLTITPRMITSWSFASKASQTYGSARVEYHDPETDEDFEGEYAGDLADLSGEDKNARTLVLNKRVKSDAEAGELAKNSFRDSNKHEVTGSFSSIGDVRLVAGVNVHMSGFGKFDGKYVIETATHSLGSSAYTASVQIRRAMGAEGRKKAPVGGAEAGWEDMGAYGEDIYR